MNFFVTGVTGNVGGAIARRLLQVHDARVWVLIRASSDEEMRARLHSVFSLWRLSGSEMSDIEARVCPVRGDMGMPGFGLSDSDSGLVRLQCDYLIHAAGVVRMNLPLDAARRHAVGSAKNLVRLAEDIASSGKRVNLAFVSTVGVAGKKPGPLLNDWVTEQREFHNTYEQSKAEAEEMLRTWKRSPNIRLTIHRPSMVVGASDGEILRHQIFYYLSDFLSGRHTRGLQPRITDARLDTVPVGYVADAVCWAVQHPETDGMVFNLCSGPDQEVALSTVQDWARQAMQRKGEELPRIHSLPPQLFLLVMRLGALMAPADVKKRLGTLPVLIDYLGSPQVFDGRMSRTYLREQAGLCLPEPKSYLPDIIHSYYE